MKQLTLTLKQIITDDSVDTLLGELLKNGKIDVQGINDLLAGGSVTFDNHEDAVISVSFDSMTVQVSDLETKNEQSN